MKIYKSQAEVEKDVKDGVLIVDESVTFEFSLSMEISLKITGDIDARDIDAGDINARNILYYAFCCVYKSISCLSIKAKREKAHPPICLDGELKFKNKK